MAIAHVGTDTGEYNANSNPSWSYTVPSGTKLLVLVFAWWPQTSGNGMNVVTSSVDGTLTLGHEIVNDSNVGASVYYLVNPTSGAHTLSATRETGVQEVHSWAASFTGVDTADPLGVTGSTSGSSSFSDGILVDANTTSGRVCVVAGGTWNSEAWSGVTGTDIFQTNQGGNTTDGGGMWEASDGSSPQSVGWSGVDGADYAGALQEFKEDAGGPADIVIFRRRREAC